MAPPTIAVVLQQIVCAVNWMRASIPEFARLAAPLYNILEKAMQTSGHCNKRKLSKVPLYSVGWGSLEAKSLAEVKERLLVIVPLTHPKDNSDMALVADASLDHGGSVLTQIPQEDAAKPLEEQRHELLAFLSGYFRDAAHRWPTIEKRSICNSGILPTS
ncbi:Retrotransposon protein, Ty3-gypsy subclass [Phytophthora megakarya]|uniref:Retrotransposon protein, Ty3-gypsy subclass n=1 Tax=Phytophthora megakarya TaxID=4795 RepID=A0A225VV69_9STRA|nr:Retrotransposon protein, Ty3-gypsy subclass [Phytophthora megakarya]